MHIKFWISSTGLKVCKTITVGPIKDILRAFQLNEVFIYSIIDLIFETPNMGHNDR